MADQRNPGRVRSPLEFTEELSRYVENEKTLRPLRENVHNAETWNDRLSAIRMLYRALEKIGGPWPEIEPYSLELDQHWTPIEWGLWKDIRSLYGCNFLPQFPAGRFFLDFADPLNKIGLEADGKQYHDAEKDRARDQELWDRDGWRVFRVTGAETYRVYKSPDEFREDVRYRLDRQATVEELDQAASDFYMKTSQGLVRAIRDLLIDKRIGDFFGWQLASLRAHRLANFPLEP